MAAAAEEDSDWTSNEEEEVDDGVIRALLVEQLEEYDPRIFNIDFNDLSDLKRIGGGNFGQVWKANYFGTKVAVKQLLDIDDADMHKYITREMLTLRDVRHPNVVQLMGLCKHSSGIYIVTEYIPGGHLRKLLKNRENELPWLLRIKISIDIIMALTYLHSRGIVHRDLKSQNLLVDEGFRIKVCDFGFSRIVEKNEFMTVCGTDEWMAPEVRLGKMYDERADVFSFAMVLTELITRNKPLERLPGRQFAFDSLAFRRTVPPDCPRALIDVTCAMAASNPTERLGFKDGLKVFKSLRKQLEGDPAQHRIPEKGSRLSEAFDPGALKVAMAAEAAQHFGGIPPSPDVGLTTIGRAYKARSEYQASQANELSIKQGDVVVIAEGGTGGLPGFVQAELNGKVGWLPEKVVHDLLADQSAAFSHAVIPSSSSQDGDRIQVALSSSTSATSSSSDKPKKKGKIARFFGRGDKKGSLREVGLNLSENQMDEIILKMIAGISVSTHKHGTASIERSFLGSDAVQWLSANGFSKNKAGGFKLMKYLLLRRVIFAPTEFKTKAELEFQEKLPYCFQLIEWRESLVLNADKMWSGTTRQAEEVIASLTKPLLTLVSEFCLTHSPDNLTPLSASKEFRRICLTAAELQKVPLDMPPTDRLTFFVNLRNFVVLLGHIRFGSPQNIRDRQTFFNSLRVYVGFHRFSIQEIESIMILGTAKFPIDDPRAAFSNPTKNTMILLALFDGNRSSSPYAYYSTKTFSDVLEETMRPWLSTSCAIDRSSNQLVLPKHIQRLSSQFGCNGLEILTILTPYLPSQVKRFLSELQQARAPLVLAYSEYDWASSFRRD